MSDLSEHSVALLTNYEREQAHFSKLQAELQARKRAKWRRALTFGLHLRRTR